MDDTTQPETQGQKSGKSPMMLVGIIGVLVILGAGYLFMQNKNAENSIQPSPTTAEAQPTVAPTMGSDSMKMTSEQAITVEGGSFYFKPNEIKVKKGQKVKITLKNSGGLHDLVIDELNVKTERIQAGATTTVEFTPDKTGTFEFYCSVGNHRAMGMKGNIIVE